MALHKSQKVQISGRISLTGMAGTLAHLCSLGKTENQREKNTNVSMILLQRYVVNTYSVEQDNNNILLSTRPCMYTN